MPIKVFDGPYAERIRRLIGELKPTSRGNRTFRKLQQLCCWKMARVTGYIYTAISWTTILAFKSEGAPLRPPPLL
jgi:hypothetical protein